MKLPFVSRELWEQAEQGRQRTLDQLEGLQATSKIDIAQRDQEIVLLKQKIEMLEADKQELLDRLGDAPAAKPVEPDGRFAEPRVLTGLEVISRGMQIREKRHKGA